MEIAIHVSDKTKRLHHIWMKPYVLRLKTNLTMALPAQIRQEF